MTGAGAGISGATAGAYLWVLPVVDIFKLVSQGR